MLSKSISILIFGGIHLMFLIGIIYSNFKLLSLIAVVPLIGYFIFENKRIKFKKSDYLFSLMAFALGFGLTYLAVQKAEVTPVYGAAIVGVFGSFIPEKMFFKGFSSAVYCGAFAGMIADFHIADFSTIISIIFIGSILFFLLKESFIGLGGKLGSIAFGSMLVPLISGEEIFVFEEIYHDVISFNPIDDLTSQSKIITTIIVSLFGTLIPYFLVNKYNVNPIKASAIPSFIISIPMQIVPISGFIAFVPIIFFGASFVGMSSNKVLRLGPLFLSSILFGAVINFVYPIFNGFGGALGTTACLCSLVGVLFQKTLQGKVVRIKSES